MKGFWNLTSTISLTLSILFLFGYNYEDVSAIPTSHLCRPEQRDALLQFKNEFQVLNSSVDPLCDYLNLTKPHGKTESWMNNSDCCTWEGITCDAKSGEVIELDLSCGNIRGKFHSNSSLRNLHSLTTLNLSANAFSGQIMSSIRNLSHITSLNLSRNHFSEFIPSSIVDLSYLTSLDLSHNSFYGQIPSSVGNLSHLTYFDLYSNQISGQIPSSIGNLSHLTDLYLSSNQISDQIPSWIGNLSHLTSLDLSSNQISGQIPSWIGNLYKLTYLDLSSNQISGQIPTSIGNLYKLTYLDLSGNDIAGEIPSSFGNINQLTRLRVHYNKLNGSFPIALLNLTKLSSLQLSGNQFTGTIPHNITSLSSLTYFDASNNAFTGTLPSSLFTIPSIDIVILSGNQLNGVLEFGNISSPPKLRVLSVGNNNLRGPIPATISKFTNLVDLDLAHYKTQGPVDFSIVSHLKLLQDLDLSYLNTTTTIDLNDFLSYFKRLSVLVLSGNHVSATNKSPVSDPPLPRYLKLSGCGITEFPEYARSQNMESLDISNNKIKGQVPCWLWTLPNLYHLNLSNNTFTGFENSTTVSRSMLYNIALFASDNNFTGKIPSLICDLVFVDTLDLSNNNFSGLIPRCLGNLNGSLLYLNLRQNHFHGGLPENIFESLRTLDVGHNQLTGKLPSSLIHFSSLEVLNVESNIFNDTFPVWLSSLPELKVLVLRSNAFHGPINCLPKNIFALLRTLDIGHNQLTGKLPRSLIHSSYLEVLNVESNIFNDTFPDWLSSLPELKVIVLRSNAFHGPLHQTSFPELQIIDISHNHFNGSLSSDYFVKWSAMSSLGTVYYDQRYDNYMGGSYYHDSMVLMNKGIEMEFVRILKIYTALDFSGNKFEGEIPRSIGLLKELHVLNLSNNAFTGHIPSSLGNLTALESLDVSQNQLSGEIPQELGKLSYLSYMNFSHNKLTGLVPGGTQFRTQNCTSFEGNTGLSGPSLEEICKDMHTSTPHETLESEEEEEEEEEEVLSWIAAVIGVIPGIAFGWLIGQILFSYKPEWFINPFVRNKRRRSSTTTH